MKVIIDISEGMYKNIASIQNGSIGSKMIINKVKDGVVLPDNATNGNIFCLFNKVSRVNELRDCVEVEVEVRPHIIWTSQFDKEWWNAKWEGGEQE